jgi:hypothetical protein
LTLVTDALLLSIMAKLPSSVHAVAYLDKSIAEHVATDEWSADGFIELSVVRLRERAEAEGISPNEIQFVLNAMGRDNYFFGGRTAKGEWLDQASVLAILCGMVRNDPAAEQAAEGVTPLHRFVAFHAVEFSCAAARGFDLLQVGSNHQG